MNGEQTTVEVVQLAAAAFASFPSSCSLLEWWRVRTAASDSGPDELGTCRREV